MASRKGSLSIKGGPDFVRQAHARKESTGSYEGQREGDEGRKGSWETGSFGRLLEACNQWLTIIHTQRRIQAIKDKRAAKEERGRYEKLAEKMHRKRVERLKRREKRNKLLKSW